MTPTAPPPEVAAAATPVSHKTAGSPQMVLVERLDSGYTIVLPGIWGDQAVDYGIVTGLKDADVQSAVELYDWTAGTLALLYNLRSLEHNRAEAQKIAAKIVQYQDQYPRGRVHLIGYSGGGAVAVLALEALPPERKVTSAVLLAPTLATDYDLGLAASRTERGIHNYYSPLDVPILMVLGTAMGTTDGQHTLAAGAVGFKTPASYNAEQRRAYESVVIQQSFRPEMLWDGHTGGHFGWANRTFAARRIAPLLAPPQVPSPVVAHREVSNAASF